MGAENMINDENRYQLKIVGVKKIIIGILISRFWRLDKGTDRSSFMFWRKESCIFYELSQPSISYWTLQ